MKKIKTEKKGYRPETRSEKYDDMLREALKPSRKVKTYSHVA